MFRTLTYLLFVFCVALPCDFVTAQQREIDLATLFDGIDLRPTDSAFIAPPREVIRPLLRCRKLMAAGEIGDAVEILGELLADDSAEDFLVPRGSRSFGSLRSRTESILGSIDARFLEPYKVRYDIRARKLFERGVAESDLSLLKRVSNQFFFTDSGANAAMLLGHTELSNGQPSAAQSWFAKVVRFPSTAAKHDPEASILLATCQLLSNNRSNARQTLVSLKARMPNSSVSVMGQNYTLFTNDDDAIAWLTSLIGDSPLASSRNVNKWLMFQGNPSRTGKTGTGIPLLAARWEHPTTESVALQKASADYVQTLIQDKAPPTPSVQPLVVGNTIVFRGLDRMFGIDAESGLRKWAWPPQLAWNEDFKTNVSTAEKTRLNQRMVMDSIYGRASSDGRLIFFVPSPGSFNLRSNRNAFANVNQSDPEDQRTYNELVAIDAESSGMLRWRVGGKSGFDEPRLAKAFFMGEPLPLEGVLYCCCVKDNAVQLVAIDANTGKLRWAQAIAAYNSESFNANYSRRLAGVTPSYADGKLVCLTGTGGVVAIEVSTRALLWGFEYRLPGSTQIVSDSKTRSNVLTDTWRDSQVTISNGMVFLTPVLSRQLICLGLDDGLGVWFEDNSFMPRIVNRESSLYLAGINNDQLILVGPRNIRAIDSFTGVEAWRTDLGVDDLPSGRGYIGDDSLFLPTTSRKILRIDLTRGAIAESVGTSRVLGNLSRVKGDVVSHGVDHVASFPEYHASKEMVERLSGEGLDASQKFIKLQTLIQQGQREQGLDVLIQLATENQSKRYSRLLNSCAVNFQDQHPALSLRALDALKLLYPNFDVAELERLRGLSNLRTGKFEESARIGLDQLERTFEEMVNAEVPESTSQVLQTINATLLDRKEVNSSQPSEIEGVEEIDFDNRYDRIQYSDFGWQRTQLQFALEGLDQQNQKAAAKLRDRVAKLVTDNFDLPANKFQWLLDRLPENALNVEALEKVALKFLDRKNYLASLTFANMAIGRDEDSANRLQLLKSNILMNGLDLIGAQAALSKVDRDRLEDDDALRFTKLSESISVAVESASKNLQSSMTWFSDSAASEKAGIVVRSKSEKQSPIRYRIPFQFSDATDPIYHSLRLNFCPWMVASTEFELRNSRGKLVRSLQIRNPDDSGSYGRMQRCYIDLQNHVAELRVGKLTFYVDWFKVLAGEGGNLWRQPIDSVGALRTAFSGGRETIVGDGNWLYCYETRNGKLVWKRKMEHEVKRVVSHGSRLTTWSESGRQFNTIESATGRLVRTMHSKRYVVSKALDDHFVLEHPIRKGELPKDQEKALTEYNGKINPAQIAKRHAFFDASQGKLVWETIFDPRSPSFYQNHEVSVLDPDGKLRTFDLRNGDLVAQLDLQMSVSEKRLWKTFNLRRHSAGWVLHVRYKDRSDSFFRGQSNYKYRSLHRSLGSGPVYLINDARTKLRWKSPAYLERMEYLESQPFDSPFILFGRHIERNHAVNGESHHMQTVCLDRETGELLGNLNMKTLENYRGYAMEWTQSEPSNSFDTLIISNTVEVQHVKFAFDAERPPVPPTHITFNAMDFFDDPVFEAAKTEVFDFRVEEFRQRAVDAKEVRAKRRAEAAAELKKRMKADLVD